MTTVVQRDEVSFTATDGYPIKGILYLPMGQHRGNILVCGATGVQQKLYRRFAEFAASQGYKVLTFDYRGLGESAPKNLKTFQMNYLDWGYLDSAAAVDFISESGKPLFYVGHSFGGHGLGLLPNHSNISAAYTFGSGAGWAGWMPKLEALKVRFLWTFVLPVIVKVKGYMAWSLLGMGDDLPKGVYQAWRQWCQYPHYLFDDPNMQYMKEKYAKLDLPCVFATAMDDPWAPPISRDAFVKAYCNAKLIKRNITHKEKGKTIGHMGYFQKNMEWLWEEVIEWFQQYEEPNVSYTKASIN